MNQVCCREAHPAPQVMPQKTLSGNLTLKCQNIVALGPSTADGVCVGRSELEPRLLWVAV